MSFKTKLAIIEILIALPRYFKGNTSDIIKSAIGPNDIEKETI